MSVCVLAVLYGYILCRRYNAVTDLLGKQMMRCSCLWKCIKYKLNANYANGSFDNLLIVCSSLVHNTGNGANDRA